MLPSTKKIIHVNPGALMLRWLQGDFAFRSSPSTLCSLMLKTLWSLPVTSLGPSCCFHWLQVACIGEQNKRIGPLFPVLTHEKILLRQTCVQTDNETQSYSVSFFSTLWCVSEGKGRESWAERQQDCDLWFASGERAHKDPLTVWETGWDFYQGHQCGSSIPLLRHL